MSKEMFCPVCNVPLNACGDLLQCPNDHCGWVGNAELWAAFIQSQRDLQIAKQDLEIAVDALKDFSIHPDNSVKEYAHNALAQINHDNKD